MNPNVKFSTTLNHNYVIPSGFNLVKEKGNVKEWSRKAFGNVRKKNLRFFRNCTFLLDDLLKLIDAAEPKNRALTFTLVECIKKPGDINSSPDQTNVLAYVSNMNAPELSKEVFLSGRINANFSNEKTLDIGKAKLKILKKDDNLTCEPPRSAYYLGTKKHTVFFEFLQDFQGKEDVVAGYDDFVNIGGVKEPLETIQVFFDISLLKNKFKLLDTNGWEELAIFPIYLYSGGQQPNCASPGDYITYMILPVENNNLVLLTDPQKPQEEFILTSGCSYPRPWEEQLDCTEIEEINISDFPKKTTP